MATGRQALNMARGKPERSQVVIYGALAANVGIAIAKFVAAGITGSSSMLSDGFHSAVDSTNEVLLLYGEHRGRRPPDRAHPFGYNREIYFWSFVVSILIFAIGAGLSVLGGWNHIQSPEELADPTVAYVVLAIAFLLEGASWIVAVRKLARSKGTRGWWEAIRHSKDPSTLVVAFEDAAALLGIAIAAAGIYLSHRLNEPRIDGAASIAIGIVLAVVAALLSREAKSLLIGEPADAALVERVRQVIDASPRVIAVNHVRTLHTAPDEVFVAASVDFDDRMSMGEGEALIEALEDRLRSRSRQRLRTTR